MNTITSNAEASIIGSAASQTSENKASQTGDALTSRVVGDAKKTNINTQKNEYQNTTNEIQLDRKQLEGVAQQLQDFMGEMSRSLQFQVDEDSGRDVIKVIDKNSGDVIKQYPSEEVLELVSKLSQTTGKLIDHKV